MKTEQFHNIRDIYGYPVYESDIGDEVVFIEPYYHSLKVGRIVKLTPKGIKVKWIKNYSSSSSDYETFVPEHNFVDISQFTK